MCSFCLSFLNRSAPSDILPLSLHDALPIWMSTAPAFGNRTFSVTAEIERERAEMEGCIVTFGDIRAGFALYVLRERLVFDRSEEHTSELQSLRHLVCRLLLEKKKKKPNRHQ